MSVIEEQISHYQPLIEDLLASAESRYRFTSDPYFRNLVSRGNLADPNQIYVLEILARFHAGALITFRRNLSWIEAIQSSYAQSSFFAFTASLRGMIESSADTYFSLRHAPLNLASYFQILKSCVSGAESTKIHLFKDLEDWGIHFLEAGKYDDKSRDKSHYKAKMTWEYIDAIDSDPFFGKVYPLYQELCQVTHPSRESTYLYFSEQDHEWIVHPVDARSRI